MTGNLIAFIDAPDRGRKLVSRTLPTGGSVIIRSVHQREPRFELEVSAGSWRLTGDTGPNKERVLSEGTYSSDAIEVRPDPYAELGRLAVELYKVGATARDDVADRMVVAIRQIMLPEVAS